MSVSLIGAIAGLAVVGTYLITSRSLSRILLGFALLGHAAVLAPLSSGGPAGEPPLADQSDPSSVANPVPQALSLTAIVISFGLALFLLALARRQTELTGDDLVEDDLEDRRLRRAEELLEAQRERADEADDADDGDDADDAENAADVDS